MATPPLESFKLIYWFWQIFFPFKLKFIVKKYLFIYLVSAIRLYNVYHSMNGIHGVLTKFFSTDISKIYFNESKLNEFSIFVLLMSGVNMNFPEASSLYIRNLFISEATIFEIYSIFLFPSLPIGAAHWH